MSCYCSLLTYASQLRMTGIEGLTVGVLLPPMLQDCRCITHTSCNCMFLYSAVLVAAEAADHGTDSTVYSRSWQITVISAACQFFVFGLLFTILLS